MPIYLALGIPEVWRYNEPVMQIYQLREGVYVECDISLTFFNLPLTTEIPRFLEESLNLGEIAMIRSFGSWLRQQLVN
jgi:hypothetical protein